MTDYTEEADHANDSKRDSWTPKHKEVKKDSGLFSIWDIIQFPVTVHDYSNMCKFGNNIEYPNEKAWDYLETLLLQGTKMEEWANHTEPAHICALVDCRHFEQRKIHSAATAQPIDKIIAHLKVL